MPTANTRAFINKVLVYLLLTVGFNGSVGLGTVWLRHQISQTAAQTKQAETKLAAIERRLAEMTARLAAEQSPDVLAAKNISMNLGLERPAELRIVRVDISPEQRLAAKRNRDLFVPEVPRELSSVRFSLVDRNPR